MDVQRLARHQHRPERHDAVLVQRGGPVEQHRVRGHDLLQRVQRLRVAVLDHAHGGHRRVPALDQRPGHERRHGVERHVRGHAYLVDGEPGVRLDDPAPHRVHRRAQHLAGERRELGAALAEGPLEEAADVLAAELDVLRVVHAGELLPRAPEVAPGVGAVLGGQRGSGPQVVAGVQHLRVEVVRVGDHGHARVAGDGPVHRRQHRQAREHVLVGGHALAAHALDGEVPLQRGGPPGLGGVAELVKGRGGLLVQVDAGEPLPDVLGGGHAVHLLGAGADRLEVPVGEPQEACEGVGHDRVGERLVELDVGPAVAVGAEDVLAEEAAVEGAEGAGLVGVAGAELAGAGHLADVVVGEGEDADAPGGLADVHAGALEVGEELALDEGLAGHGGDAAGADAAPELGVALAADELGVGEDVEGGVPGEGTDLQGP